MSKEELKKHTNANDFMDAMASNFGQGFYKSTSYTSLRENLSQFISLVNKKHGKVLWVTQRNKKPVVIMSETKYKKLIDAQNTLQNIKKTVN